MTKKYSADSIKLLKFPDNLRKRPEMYIGSIEPVKDGTNPAIYQITKEVLDNAIDEHLAKYARNILIKVDKDTITIADDGRGVPVEYHKVFKTSTLVGVFSNMHASGKFDKESYDTSIGTHGLGSKATNALSASFKVWTCRNNKWWHVAFEKGLLKQDVTKSKCPIKGWDGGTIVSFAPDKSLLKGRLDFDKLHATAKILSYITTASVTIEKNGKSKTYKSKNGLTGYLSVMNKQYNAEMSEVFALNKDGTNVALCWIDKDISTIESFCNASRTSEGGTHVKGLQKAIADAFKRVYKKAKFDYADIASGMLCVLSKAVREVRFDSQTKERLLTKESEGEVYDCVTPQLVKWIKKHHDFCDDLVAKAERLKALRSKSLNDRAVLKALKGKRGKSDLPPAKKFAESTTKNPEERILFIVEGDSAKGPCVSVRDPRIHEVLALRGKIMNVLRGKKEIFESDEVVNILKAVGYNEKGTWRVGKVVLFMDSDPDGSQICALVLALLMTVCPQLLKECRVYLVDAPLFVGKTATHEYYGQSLGDLYRQCKSIKSVTRIKGWGEAPLHVLKKAAFSKESKLVRVKYSDIDVKKVHDIMGSNVSERKALLELLK